MEIVQTPQFELKAGKILKEDNSCDSGIYVLGYIQEFLKSPDLFIEDLIQNAPPRWSIKPSELRTFWREMILGVQMKDDSRVLTSEQLLKIDQFRDEIRRCATDSQRYERCVQIRDDLLKEQTESQYLADICERAIFSQCVRYRDWKEARETSGKPSELDEGDVAEWDRFLKVAKAGGDERSKRVSALRKVESCWGHETVQHYEWASRGRYFCDKLATAARRIVNWRTAAAALNSAMLRRSQKGQTLKRRPIHASPSPVELIDLLSLCKTSPIEEPMVVPEGLGFDRFGLLVQQDYAAFLRTATGSVAPAGKPDYSTSLSLLLDEQRVVPEGFGFDDFGLLVPSDRAVFLRPADRSDSSGLSTPLVAGSFDLSVGITHPPNLSSPGATQSLTSSRDVLGSNPTYTMAIGNEQTECGHHTQNTTPNDQHGSTSTEMEATTEELRQPSCDSIIKEVIETFLAECSPVPKPYADSAMNTATTLSAPLASEYSPISADPLGLCNATADDQHGSTDTEMGATAAPEELRQPSCDPVADSAKDTPAMSLVPLASGPGHILVSANDQLDLCNASDGSDRAAAGTDGPASRTPECAEGTSPDPSITDPPPSPHIPGYANATTDHSIASETTDQRDLDTEGAIAGDGQDSPANAIPDRPPRMALRPRMPPSFQGMASSSRTKPRIAKPREVRPSTNEVPEMPLDCCPELPLPLRSALDKPFPFSRETANRFFPFLEHLCYEHLQRYVKLWYHTEQAQVVAVARSAEHLDTPNRRRRASLPDITPSKRPRLDTPLRLSRRPGASEDRPAYDHIPNDAYKQRALADLKQATPLRGSHGAETNPLIRELLEKVEHPNTESSRGKLEALFCTGDEAAHIVETRSVDAPIITEGQQPFEWGENGRPIEQILRRFSTSDDLLISVQTPSLPATGQSFQVRKFGEVKKQFLDQKITSDPLNLLDLQCPVQSTVPKFLSGENCGLLLDVRNRVLMEGSAERVTASLQRWAEWKDVDKWALLSEGGHHTAPHMDSHGYATWITSQEGPIGFAWMSLPTVEERQAWMAAPHQYTGGRWRYIILKPGQTVFFPPGTIHFVFRVRDHQTLALGGHVLQWSSIQHWIQVVLWELKKPATTNEEMKMTAPKLVHTVAELVRAKVNNVGVQELGGEDAVKVFFESVKVRMIRDCDTGGG
jgi:hypothetical protein